MLVRGLLGVAVLIAVAGCPCDLGRDGADAVLRVNLKNLREVIQDYEGSDGCLRELEQLVAEDYLRQLPVDPFATEGSTWLAVRDDAGCIHDVRSTSTETARDGSRFREW